MKRALAVVALTVALVTVPTAVAFAADASYRTLSSASHPDWMRTLPDSRSLAALSIPGTHETMSIWGGSSTQTQENFDDTTGTLRRQLDAGIRAIDIRGKINSGNSLAIYHGAVSQRKTFADVLDTLRTFLATNPGETVLLRLKQECTGELGSCTDAAGQKPFPDIFDAYAARYAPLFWAPSVNRNSAAAMPTLGEVRGKIVLLVLNGARGGRYTDYGLSQFADWKDGSSTYVQDNYSVSPFGGIEVKAGQVRSFLDSTNAGDPTTMYVNFASGASLFVPPQSVAEKVNPNLLGYLSDRIQRTGVVMLDFPGGGLVDRIVAYDR
jgi:1-phosphatidylinositol phosphodiesterase